MGLFGDIYGMVRQSEQDELNKKVIESRLARENEAYQRNKAEYADKLNKRDLVYSGLGDLSEIDRQMAENDTRISVLQQDAQRMANPVERRNAELQVLLLNKENQRLDRLSRVREAQMHYQAIDADMAKAKSLDIADAVNGIRTRNDIGMATVKKKVAAGVDPETRETIYDEVTYKAPYGQVIGSSGKQSGSLDSYYSAYDPSVAEQAIQTTGGAYSQDSGSGMTVDQSMKNADYLNSGGSVMYSSPEISTPTPIPNAPTPMQSSDEKTRALSAYNRAQTPEGKEKIRQAAASRGIQIP